MPASNRQKFSLKRILPSRIFLVLGVIILILFSISLSKEIIRRYDVNREINQLKTEVEELEKRNAELAELIQYLNTESFQEKEARTKLGMAKPGEKVVVIPEVKEEQTEGTPSLSPPNLEELSNPQRWWNYFFSQ